jgi:hypothetical protein
MVKLVSELRASVGRLRELSKLPLKKFLNDPEKLLHGDLRFFSLNYQL